MSRSQATGLPEVPHCAVSWVGEDCPNAGPAGLTIAGIPVVTYGRRVDEFLPWQGASKRDVVIASLSPDDVDPADAIERIAAAAGRGARIIALLGRPADTATVLEAGAEEALPREVDVAALSGRIRHWLAVAEHEREHLRRMNALIERTSECEKRARELAAENARLQRECARDPLTGLLNRQGFLAELDFAIAVCALHRGSACLIALEVECGRMTRNFPSDSLLRQIADLLRDSSRLSDLPARTGRRTFALLLPAARIAKAGRVAARLRAQIQALPDAATAWIGVATMELIEPDSALAADEMLASAACARTLTKQLGGDKIVFHG